jgi:hypothetical protein
MNNETTVQVTTSLTSFAQTALRKGKYKFKVKPFFLHTVSKL